MNLKDTYNKIGDAWFRDHQPDAWWHEGADKFISFLKPDASALDVGCGGGIASKYLIEKGLSVAGVDFSEKMIEIATREVPLGKFFVGDMNDLDFLEKNFDGLYVKASLLHIPKKEIVNVILKLKQNLKPGGNMYVAVKEAKPEQKEEQIKVESDYGYEYQRFFSFFTLSEMEKYFADASFKVCWKKITPSGKTLWIEIIGQ